MLKHKIFCPNSIRNIFGQRMLAYRKLPEKKRKEKEELYLKSLPHLRKMALSLLIVILF